MPEMYAVGDVRRQGFSDRSFDDGGVWGGLLQIKASGGYSLPGIGFREGATFPEYGFGKVQPSQNRVSARCSLPAIKSQEGSLPVWGLGRRQTSRKTVSGRCSLPGIRISGSYSLPGVGVFGGLGFPDDPIGQSAPFMVYSATIVE